jgi:3-oxocholest-4-en-26-oyl-CoA dehydrogenase alpha subunit
VHVAETPEHQALRKELREYFAALLTDDVRAKLGDAGEGGELWRPIVRRMGADGWLGFGWPREYGGQGRSPLEQFIVFDEIQRASAPFPFVTVNTVGPALMRFGTDEQKQRFLPGMLAGDINFAIGYTEPDAGTDLASLRTRAARDGDEYVINGTKIFTSGANQADFVWLACRTDADAPKHKGISIIAVPTDAPGFSWSPIVTVGSVTTTVTYYADVRVPVANRIGDENQGWRMITTQLNHERVGLAAMGGRTIQLFEDVRDWAREAGLLERAWVRADLARAHARLEAMKLLNWRMACAIADDTLGPAQASAAKVYGTETHIEVYRILMSVLGALGHLRAGSPGAVLRGRVELNARSAQINTFGGGVNEVQREIVAAAGLGMTRTARGS